MKKNIFADPNRLSKVVSSTELTSFTIHFETNLVTLRTIQQ